VQYESLGQYGENAFGPDFQYHLFVMIREYLYGMYRTSLCDSSVSRLQQNIFLKKAYSSSKDQHLQRIKVKPAPAPAPLPEKLLCCELVAAMLHSLATRAANRLACKKI
jgi:hypothetical protein